MDGWMDGQNDGQTYTQASFHRSLFLMQVTSNLTVRPVNSGHY